MVFPGLLSLIGSPTAEAESHCFRLSNVTEGEAAKLYCGALSAEVNFSSTDRRSTRIPLFLQFYPRGSVYIRENGLEVEAES
jgi:hypothetical protein